MELIQGCRNLAELRRVEQFLRRFAVRSLSELIGGIGTSLMRRYRLSHGLLLPDALIAATAIEYDVTLYTKNVRPLPDDPRSDGGAPLLKPSTAGRLLLASLQSLFLVPRFLKLLIFLRQSSSGKRHGYHRRGR